MTSQTHTPTDDVCNISVYLIFERLNLLLSFTDAEGDLDLTSCFLRLTSLSLVDHFARVKILVTEINRVLPHYLKHTHCIHYFMIKTTFI